MVLVLPPFLTLAGIVLLGVLIGFVVYGLAGVLGFCLADSSRAGEALLFLAPLLGVLSAICAWVWLWGMA